MISAVSRTRPLRKVSMVLEMIKFEHTVFALPFALSSALVAAGGLPEWRTLGWILVAMAGARSSAMAFNRIADVKLDAMNPRTQNRALPAGLVSLTAAWALTAASAGLLVLAAYMLNPLAFALSPVAVVVILSYSYSKRFTTLSHLWLGLCLGIAPVGAWIAVTGRIEFAPVVLSTAVMLWTAGFDIIYALQDIEFDRRMSLLSLPARLGAGPALRVSRLCHAATTASLVWFGLLCRMGSFYFVGVALVALALVYEQGLVSPNDIRRVNAAFFTTNGFVSLTMLVFVALDIFV